jgi:hypothetical protein
MCFKDCTWYPKIIFSREITKINEFWDKMQYKIEDWFSFIASVMMETLHVIVLVNESPYGLE